MATAPSFGAAAISASVSSAYEIQIHEASEITKCTDSLSSVLRGGYPRYLVNDGKIQEFFKNYTTTYVERDVHQLLNIKNATLFTTFLKLIVGRIGSIFMVDFLTVFLPPHLMRRKHILKTFTLQSISETWSSASTLKMTPCLKS